MPKDYFQDITPPHGSPNSTPTGAVNGSNGFERTIRNIPINPRRHMPTTPLHSASSSANHETESSPGSGLRAKLGGAHRGVKKYFIVGGAAILLVALIVVTVAAFRATSVVVTPRTHTIVLTEDIALTAYSVDDKNADPTSLLYSPATNAYEAEQIVTAAGFEEVQEYARGVVTIYNEYSNTPVRLIKNTRFETPSGLTFRARDSIVVPGKKGAAPGTVTATIYADQPGDKYNSAPVDHFALPGLKNTSNDMFTHVYARSVVAFSGGFVGSKPKVAEADLANARKALRAGLEEKARTEAAALTAPNMIVFPQLLSITFEAQEPLRGEDGQVRVREKAKVTLPAFNETIFARALAAATRADLGEAAIHIKDSSRMTVRKVATDDKPFGAPIDIVISGSAGLVWEVDTAALAATLANTPKETFKVVTGGFPGIEEANAYIRPMWRSTFPTDPADIKIILNEPKSK